MTVPEQSTRFYAEGDTLGHPARAKRTSVMLIALLEHFGKQAATSHRVRDLSAGGMRIDNAATLKAGATVLISIGALHAIGATVKWVHDGFAGLAFAEQIDLEDAQTKAVIAPDRAIEPTRSTIFKVAPAPTAGWIEEIRSPYRR